MRIVSQEFVEFHYAKAVVPTKIEIYETSCPGALVKISGKGPSGAWVELYSGPADKAANSKSRIFSPSLKTVEEPISEFRFDIDATGWVGWYEIDAVSLTGSRVELVQPAVPLPSPHSLAADLLALFQSQTGDVTFICPNGDVCFELTCVLDVCCVIN